MLKVLQYHPDCPDTDLKIDQLFPEEHYKKDKPEL